MSDDFLVFLVSCDMYTSFCPVPASGSSTTVRQAQVTNDEVWHRNFESLGITCFFSAWITGKYIHVKSYKYSMAKVNRRDQISGYRCLEARTPFMYYIYISKLMFFGCWSHFHPGLIHCSFLIGSASTSPSKQAQNLVQHQDSFLPLVPNRHRFYTSIACDRHGL